MGFVWTICIIEAQGSYCRTGPDFDYWTGIGDHSDHFEKTFVILSPSDFYILILKKHHVIIFKDSHCLSTMFYLKYYDARFTELLNIELFIIHLSIVSPTPSPPGGLIGMWGDFHYVLVNCFPHTPSPVDLLRYEGIFIMYLSILSTSNRISTRGQ